MNSNQEGDEILILQLRQLGVSIDDSITKIADFDKKLLYSSAVACVRATLEKLGKPIEDFPDTLPREMAVCFRTCTTLAETIHNLGFKKKIGFDNFLYPNERDTRELLGWLLEIAQTQEEGGQQTSVMDSDKLSVRINEKLQFLVKSTWTQRTRLNPNKTREAFQADCIETIYSPANRCQDFYSKNYLDFILNHVEHPRNLSSSIFEENLHEIAKHQEMEDEWNSKGMDSASNMKEYYSRKRKDLLRKVTAALRTTKSSTFMPDVTKLLQSTQKTEKREISSFFTNKQKFEAEETDVSKQVNAPQEEENPEEAERKRQEQLEELQQKLDKVLSHIDKMRNNIDTQKQHLVQITESLSQQKENNQQLTKTSKILQATIKLGGNSEEEKLENIRKMEKISASTAQHLLTLASEWENHRKPLVEKYRALKEKMSSMKDEYKNKLESVKQNRIKMKNMIQDIRQKESLVKQLKEQVQSLPKTADRQIFVVRILDIVRHVEKQKDEMTKILVDIKSLQKEIAVVSESLDKTFNETEELIFRDVSETKDPISKNIYKYLVEMRSAFNKLIEYVRETGNCANQIRDLEGQINHMNQRKDALNVESIYKDLEQIKKENNVLIEHVKKLKQ